MKKRNVTVLIGAGAIGLAVARRVSAVEHILIADLKKENAEASAVTLEKAGFKASFATVDVSQKESVKNLSNIATQYGKITKVILATGLSPSNAPSKLILKVDFYGAALILEEFEKVIAPGGSGLVIGSQSSHRLEPLGLEQEKLLATTPADELLNLPLLNTKKIADPLHAYQVAKKGCSLRVKASAVTWGKKGARVNIISPGIITSPLSGAELSSENKNYYKRMLEVCPAGRAGTPDEVATLAALVMGPDGAFITGSDFLMDGGVTASFRFGELQSVT